MLSPCPSLLESGLGVGVQVILTWSEWTLNCLYVVGVGRRYACLLSKETNYQMDHNYHKTPKSACHLQVCPFLTTMIFRWTHQGLQICSTAFESNSRAL